MAQAIEIFNWLFWDSVKLFCGIQRVLLLFLLQPGSVQGSWEFISRIHIFTSLRTKYGEQKAIQFTRTLATDVHFMQGRESE